MRKALTKGNQEHRDWVTDEVQHLLDVDAAYMVSGYSNQIY